MASAPRSLHATRLCRYGLNGDPEILGEATEEWRLADRAGRSPAGLKGASEGEGASVAAD